MSTQKKITLETRGHILLMGVNRPEKRNAFNTHMLADLARAYTQLEDDPNLRCGVLFAHGDHFTAGLDLGEVAPHIDAGNSIVPDGLIDPWGVHSEKVRTKPLVIAVQGKCLTLGIELSLAADIVIAAENTIFGQIEVKRGIFPFGGATIRMPERVGWGNAMRYLLTGDEFNAQTAHRIGMVQELTPVGGQLDKAMIIATSIAKQAPLGVQATIRSARKAYGQTLPQDTSAYLMAELDILMKSKDAQEGLASFLERRKANFIGE